MTVKTTCRMNNVQHVISYAGANKRSMAFDFLSRLGKGYYKLKSSAYFHSRHCKDMCFASDAIDSSVNPRTLEK